MSDGTKIEWAANADGSPGASWNPIRARDRATGKVGWFCVHASEGCRNCYAEAINLRLGTGHAFKAHQAAGVDIFLDERALGLPLRWKKPRTIFVCSMSDLFGEFVSDAIIDRVFALMALCPEHTFIVLTKRAARMRKYFARPNASRCAAIGRHVMELSATDVLLSHALPLPNVWLGVSVEANRNRDRLTDLIHTPAAVRFCSAEPLIDPLDLAPFLTPAFEGDRRKQQSLPILDWVIAGGESGRHARPMHPRWARDVRDQCERAGVAFFFKQWGEWAPAASFAADPDELTAIDGTDTLYRVGKKTAGRVLDGRTHDDRPPLAHQTGAIA